MKVVRLLGICLMPAFAALFAMHPPGKRPSFGLVIHGGAGVMARENFTAEREQAYHKVLGEVLEKGYRMLEKGAPAMDVVEQCIWIMEDSPLFNAGRGAVFTYDGINELDASVMDGKDQKAGAVSGVRTVRHPISAARKVMENSPHVLLTGAGADEFAKEQCLEIVENEWFRDSLRYQRWLDAKAKEKNGPQGGLEPDLMKKFGTVGVVVLDKAGNLAAGTSTGGMNMKRWGRVGDSPLIGAGTWADNNTCAISCTGHGEYFIRYAVAHEVAARMEHGGQSLQKAADEVVNGVLKEAGGEGGLIGIDRKGNFVMTFNTSGMFRGSFMEGGKPMTAIFR